jgi:hypothetical protein
MSDFLRRLAGRSLGIEPVVQPAIPAMTAPAPRDAGFFEGESVSEVVERPSNADSPRFPKPTAMRESTERNRSSEATVPAAHLWEPRESIAQLAPASRATDPASSEDTLPAIEVRSDAGNSGDLAVTGPSKWDSTLPDPYSPAPSLAFVGMPIERRESLDAAAPVVRVTIGRVEVRAELPSPKARTAAPRTRPATTSLDDYLKQRAEGRR